MYPPSAPIYWNTRPRWYGIPEISRKELTELIAYRWLKIERVQINKQGEPEYISIVWDRDHKSYIVDIIRPKSRHVYYGATTIMDISNYLYKECQLVTVI